MSLRRMTDEQVAAGTTVDGLRLEKALGDFEEYFNAVPVRDLERRFVQTQFVAGYLPDPTPSEFLPFSQSVNTLFHTGTPPEAYENARRSKGTAYTSETTLGTQQLLEVAHKIVKPVLLVQVDWFLVTDTVYTNTFLYDASPPAGKTNGDHVSDFGCTVTVDNRWNPEDRSQNTLLRKRMGFDGVQARFSRIAPTGHTDMLPNHPDTAQIEGLAVSLQDIVVPIPRDSRIRHTLALPAWVGGLEPWGSFPTSLQYYSAVFTYLEMLEPA